MGGKIGTFFFALKVAFGSFAMAIVATPLIEFVARVVNPELSFSPDESSVLFLVLFLLAIPFCYRYLSRGNSKRRH